MSVRSRWLRRALLGLMVLVIVGAFVAVLHPRGRAALIEGVSWLRAAGTVGQLLAIAMVVVAIPMGFPTLWFAAMIGYLFGLDVGVPLAILALPLGATSAFLITRSLLYDEVRGLVAKRPALAATVDAVGDGGWRLIALLRVAGPHNLLNAVLAASPVSTRGFFLGTVIGGAPSIGLAASGGALAPDAAALWKAGKSFGPLGIAVLIVGALTFIAALALVRKRAKQALAKTADSGRKAE